MLIGGVSQIKTTIALLREVAHSGIPIDYIHFISGQDYPLVSNKAFDNFFESHTPTSFMYYSKHEEWMKKNLPPRYRCWHWNDVLDQRSRNLIVRNISKLWSKLQVVPYREEIPHIAYGHNWFSWHRQVMDFILRYINQHPEFLKRFHYTNCCDEIFFHTILYPYINELHIDTSTSLRYVDWTRPQMILTEDDYEKIIESSNLFCRKIDPIKSRGLKEKLNVHIQT